MLHKSQAQDTSLLLKIVSWLFYSILLWPRLCHCTRQLSTLSTLSCPVSCTWPHEVSDAVHGSPLWSCQSIVSFAFSSFWFHVHSRCMLFWGIVRSSSDSDVQSIIDACSVFCLLFQVWNRSLISSLLNISSFLILSLLFWALRHAYSWTLRHGYSWAPHHVYSLAFSRDIK